MSIAPSDNPLSRLPASSSSLHLQNH